LVVLIILVVFVFSAVGYFFWQQKQQAIQVDTSGIFGVATIGPTCPGPQRIGQVCEKPYQGTIAIGTQVQTQSNTGEFKEIKRITTNSDGRFRVSLPPGDYVAKRLDSPMLYGLAKTSIRVDAGRFSEVNILFDTGIR